MQMIFPYPSRLEEKNGTYPCGKEVYLTVDDSFRHPGFEEMAAELWGNFTGGLSTLRVVRIPGDTHTAMLSNTAVLLTSAETEEDYELTVDKNGARFIFGSPAGLMHGFYTLLQLLPPFRRHEGNAPLPFVAVADHPALGFRALDISVFHGESFHFLRRMIRLAALLKYTHVQLEFWGSLEFACCPAASWEGAFTQEEIKMLVKEGTALGIEFIPFFNHYGHASMARFRTGKHVFLDQAPEMADMFLPGGWTWDVTNPAVEMLHRSIREELCALFPGKYFHMGCDEVFNENGFIDPYDKAENDAYVAHINRCADAICRMGRTPIMWADMLLDGGKFRYPFTGNYSHRASDSDRNLPRIDERLILCDWQYEINGDKPETLDYLLQYRPAEKLLTAPWHKLDNIEGRAMLAKEKGLMGMIDTTWDLVHKEVRSVSYAACGAWEQDMRYCRTCSGELMTVRTMELLRKLLPCGGDFKDAGVFDHEIDAIVGTVG